MEIVVGVVSSGQWAVCNIGDYFFELKIYFYSNENLSSPLGLGARRSRSL